jgi:DNA repair exonuclease SbcCD ATPase subunit
MDSQKIELSKEAEKLKAMSENAVQDVKYIYEQEKIILNERVEKLQAQVKSLETHKEMISQVSANETQSNYIKEVKELNTHLEQYKREHEDEILSLKTQRDDALKKVEALEQNLLSAKNIVRSDKAAGNLKVKLDKVKELHAQNSYLQDEMKKYKKVVYQLKSQILKLESSEKRLKNMLLEKDTQIDAMSKKISKAPQDEDIKANYDKKKNTILQEIITKDGQIALLSKQLEDTKKELELSSNGSISTVKYSSRNNTEFSKSVCNGKEIISLQATSKLSHVTIQKAEYQQLVDCQSIVDGCSEARCRKCHSYFPLNDFVAHIESSCQCNDGELPLPSNNEQLMKKFEKLEKIKKQKDQADLEIQRLREELEMLKKKCAVAEEKKAESELSLKTEIKFLIGKLMKYKSKNEKPSTIAHNENISPEQSQDKNTQAKSGITSPGMNCVARSISNFMKSTPHTDRNSNNSQLTSDKKSDYDECLFSPSETKTVKIPQFMKRNTKENSTIRGAKK